MLWVATRNGTVRHPVNIWYGDEKKSAPKNLLCRSDEITFVHLCTQKELDELRACYQCKTVLRNQARQDKMEYQLMRET